MRLLKAVQDGGLSVPKESLQIEKNLKKEWKERDSNNQVQVNTKIMTTKTVTTKTITVSKTTASKTTASKTTESKTTASKTMDKPALPKAAAKPTAIKTAAAKHTTPKAAPGKRKRASDDETPYNPQTAKRRVNSKRHKTTRMCPKTVTPNRAGGLSSLSTSMHLPFRSSDIEWNWPDAIPFEILTLSLRLNGTEIWGAYEFGAFEGVLWMPERPMKPSFDSVPFKWRGRETSEGEMSYEDDQGGWIEFLGDGDIVGMISCYGDLHFRGQRIDSSVRTASDLRSKWDGFNDEAWGEENRGRWGGW
ncbi:hypothetical protein PENCOP_c001G05641 [Penicillium coprophilum]|uniref:Uncharacterized protein n=1 Tax=Penicillium coprophilum TaxID=36646 RepID=A0A1V6V8L8_9EURO|nr:hypothetical protein PENCOP_c001G05641 [Penicillium coprophilum]